MRFDETLQSYFVPADREPREREQLALVVRAWTWSLPPLVLLFFMFWASHLWMQLVNQTLTIIGAVLALYSVRWRAPVWLSLRGSMLLGTLTFCGAALAQTPMEPSSVFFLAVIPLGAAFGVGFREGVIWAVIASVFGVGTLSLGHAGYTWPDVDPAPEETMALNFFFFVMISLALARGFTRDREIAMERVQAADRAKSRFLANVSHELRTPMNGVVGMAEVLLQDPSSATVREQLEVIHRSGQSMVLLVNDLIDLARVEEGRFALLPVVFDLHELVGDVMRLYGPLAAAKGVDASLALDPAVPHTVRGDGLRLRQVLANLLSNAVKFTSHGSVRLEVGLDRSRITFAVTDTGAGITPSTRARLFQRFEQGDASSARRAGGAGLGLALSRELVSLMGGELTLDDAWSPGARFAFSLELQSEAALPRHHTPVPVRASGPVLVVDDNPINLAVARSLLARAGFDVAIATNGREALDWIQANRCLLVFMDVQMPEMDGLEATRRIRALPGPVGALPIVALTASALPEEHAACLTAGMNDVLGKPFSMSELKGLLDRLSLRT